MLADMQEGKLTRLWTCASGAPPLGWRLAGVMTQHIASQWAPTGTAASEDEWLTLALETDGPGSGVGTGASHGSRKRGGGRRG
jgi:hypothetical protein